MINEEIVIEKKEKKEYPPIPKDIYQAQILDINLVDAKGKYAEPGDKNFAVQFTLLNGKDGENDLRGRSVWANFIPTFLYISKKGKNDLYNIIEAILKRELEPEEEATFNKDFMNDMIGKQIRIMIEPNQVGDKTYDNIANYLSITDELTPLTAEEKEKSSVKKKEESTEGKVEESEVNVDEVPF